MFWYSVTNTGYYLVDFVRQTQDLHTNAFYTLTEMTPGPATFSGDEVKDLRGMVKKLTEHSSSDPVSSFLWQAFSNKQSVLKAYQPSATNANQVMAIIAKTLNKVIKGSNIYEEARFKGIHLRDETLRLRKDGPQDDLPHFNRLLIEDAYTNELSRDPPEIPKSADDDTN